MEYSTEGIHIIADVWGVDFDKLNNIQWLRERMVESILSSGATIISFQEKQFEPSGVTILIMLEESHMSIHTYPTKGFASLDAYTCGSIDPTIAIMSVISELSPEDCYTKKIIRGSGTLKED
jgi:S-adenosylmethionine decarboxylase